MRTVLTDLKLTGLALANLAGVHGTGEAFFDHAGNTGLPPGFGSKNNDEVDRLTTQAAVDFTKQQLGSWFDPS